MSAEALDTVAYYDRNAAEFFASTVGVDMSELHARFLARLPRGAFIPDAGCVSGRDARAFAEQGFRVAAFDASPELAGLASAYCGFGVPVRQFAEVTEVPAYDAI